MYKVAICDDQVVFLNHIENRIIEFCTKEKVLIFPSTQLMHTAEYLQ